jgi:hypothetical protein
MEGLEKNEILTEIKIGEELDILQSKFDFHEVYPDAKN